MLALAIEGGGTMSEQKPGGYGTNWRKWLLIYLVVGVVAYLLIYFLFFSDGGYF
jgi:hypothetical protein